MSSWVWKFMLEPKQTWESGLTLEKCVAGQTVLGDFNFPDKLEKLQRLHSSSDKHRQRLVQKKSGGSQIYMTNLPAFGVWRVNNSNPIRGITLDILTGAIWICWTSTDISGRRPVSTVNISSAWNRDVYYLTAGTWTNAEPRMLNLDQVRRHVCLF